MKMIHSHEPYGIMIYTPEKHDGLLYHCPTCDIFFICHYEPLVTNFSWERVVVQQWFPRYELECPECVLSRDLELSIMKRIHGNWNVPMGDKK